MRTGARRHTHKYHRLTDGLWHCALPNCTHYLPRNMPLTTIMDKDSICWQCDKKFQIDSENIKQDKPICSDCRAGIKQANEISLDGIIIR